MDSFKLFCKYIKIQIPLEREFKQKHKKEKR